MVRSIARLAGVVVFILLVGLWPGACGGGDEAGGPWERWDAGGDDAGRDDARDAAEWDTAGEDGGGEDVWIPPEEEETPDFRAPQGSHRFVYLSNTVADNVVVIDSSTLMVDLVGVGDSPTALAALGTRDAAAVINGGSDTVSLIRTDASGSTVTEEGISPEANALSVSPDGMYGVAYYDVVAAGSAPLPSSLQDVSLLDFEPGAMRVVQTAVGSRPTEVEWSDDGATAYVVAEHHICVVDFLALPVGLPPCVGFGMVPSDPGDPGSTRIARPVEDVEVSGDGRLALLRTSGAARVDVLEMASGGIVEVALPSIPSDVDLSADGMFALAALRDEGLLARIDLADLDAPGVFVTSLSGMLAGQVVITDDGSRAVVFSSVSRDVVPGALTEVLGVLDMETGSVTLVPLQKEVRSVAVTPDNAVAVVIHRKSPGNPDDPLADLDERIDRSYGFSMVRLSDGWTSLQTTPTDPGPFVVYEDAGRAYLTLRDDAAGIREVRVADLASFVVRSIPLGSPPASIGIAPYSRKVFVGQIHPTGRITFLSAADGSAQTVTGFQLNDWIVE